MNVPQPALDHSLGAGAVVFLQQIFFQGASVDADANRNSALRRRPDDLFDVFARSDIAGIEAQAVDSLLNGDQGELVVEVNVGDQRNANLSFDFAELFRRFAHRHGAPRDLATGGF